MVIIDKVDKTSWGWSTLVGQWCLVQGGWDLKILMYVIDYEELDGRMIFKGF